MRSWMGVTSGFAAVVMSAQDSIAVPSARPPVPHAGERERPSFLQPDEPRLARAAEALPFVEPLRGHEAAALAKGVAEGRARGHALRASVDEAVPHLRVLRPARDQAPPEQPCLPRARRTAGATASTSWVGAML